MIVMSGSLAWPSSTWIDRLGNSVWLGLEVLPDLHLDHQGPQHGYQQVRELWLIGSISSAWPSSTSPMSSTWSSTGRGTQVDWVRKFFLTFIYTSEILNMVFDGSEIQFNWVQKFCLIFIYISNVLNMVINRLGNLVWLGIEVLPNLHLHLWGPQHGYRQVRELRYIWSECSAWPSSRSPRSSRGLSTVRGKTTYPFRELSKDFSHLRC